MKGLHISKKTYICSGSYHKDLQPLIGLQVKGFINFGFWFLKILA